MEESRANYERRMKKMEELVGSWSNNQGQFLPGMIPNPKALEAGCR